MGTNDKKTPLEESREKYENNDKTDKNVTLPTVNNTLEGVKDVHDAIIKAQFVGGKDQIGENGEEVIDIVTEYYWIQNKPVMTGKKDMLAPVPFCYAIEYKQRYGVTATNITNKIVAISNTVSNIGKNVLTENLYGGLKEAFAKIKDTINSALSSVVNNDNVIISSVGKGINYFGEIVGAIGGGKIDGSVWNGNSFLDTELLSPYFYLYSLEHTNKKFCFPFLTDGAASWNIANNFSADGSPSLLTQTLSTTLDAVDSVIKFAADIQDMSNLLSNDANAHTGFTMYNIEKAKAFSFPAGGKIARVRFPLFNTIEKGAWEDNYRFIMLFGLRNMLFRKNNVQYYPPLFYDVSIPGFGRMPLSYVKSFTVKPVGMTRVKNINLTNLGLGLNYGNFQTNLQTSVIVPEAWVVDIEFESLIADSANQFLSSMFDLPVQVNLETSETITAVNLHDNNLKQQMKNMA